MTQIRATPDLAGADAAGARSASPERWGPGGRSVSWALAARGVIRMKRLPTIFIPVIVMPVFFVVAFSGAFSALGRIDGYGTESVASWMTPFALLQGAAFGGVGAAAATANDLENGFYDRLLLAPVSRTSLLSGPLLYAMLRAVVPATLVMLIGWAVGAEFPGGVLGITLTYVAAFGVAAVAGTWGMWVVYVVGNQRGLAIVQVGIFTLMFLSIGQVPLALMNGWLQDVARFNPMTNILRLARQGFIGDVTWADTWPGLVALGSLILVFGAFAYRSLDKLTR